MSRDLKEECVAGLAIDNIVMSKTVAEEHLPVVGAIPKSVATLRGRWG
jgi:hypothetical protein